MAFGRAKKTVREPLGEAELMEFALKSLTARMQSIRDLRRKLMDRAVPGLQGERDADAVIARLVELGYMNDERFAADFTRLRQENRAHGRRRVQQDLQLKGVAGEVAKAALDAAYEGVDEVALVRQHMERKRLAAPTDEKSTARVLRRLIAAGFSSKAIFAALKGMKVEGEALEQAETEAGEE